MQIGQAGLRVGDACWELFNLEHGIDAQGRPFPDSPAAAHPHNFYQELPSGRLLPRALHVDTDGYSVDEVRTGPLRDLFSPQSCVAGKEDTSSNFVRGNMTLGREIVDQTMDRLRKMAEVCDRLQGFVWTHSIGGGTGSGFTSLLADRLHVEQPKKTKVGVTVYPSPSTLTTIVEPYNAILATSCLADFTDLNLVFRNSQVHRHLQQLDVEQPTFASINRHIAQCVASATSGMRFPGSLSTSLESLVVNTAPYPKAHFLMASYAAREKERVTAPSVGSLTKMVFDGNHTPYER